MTKSVRVTWQTENEVFFAKKLHLRGTRNNFDLKAKMTITIAGGRSKFI